MPRLAASIVGLLLLVGSSCARAGRIQGDVFVVADTADVKRGADTEIILVQSTPSFEAAWKTKLAAWEELLRTSLPALKDAARESDAAYAEATEALDAVMRTGMRGAEYEGAKQIADAAVAKHSRASEVTGARRGALQTSLVEHAEAAEQLIRKSQFRSLRSDINGHYEITSLPRGRYYLYAKNQTFFLKWFVPVELSGTEQKVDLSRGNAGWPFFPPSEI